MHRLSRRCPGPRRLLRCAGARGRADRLGPLCPYRVPAAGHGGGRGQRRRIRRRVEPAGCAVRAAPAGVRPPRPQPPARPPAVEPHAPFVGPLLTPCVRLGAPCRAPSAAQPPSPSRIPCTCPSLLPRPQLLPCPARPAHARSLSPGSRPASRCSARCFPLLGMRLLAAVHVLKLPHARTLRTHVHSFPVASFPLPPSCTMQMLSNQRPPPLLPSRPLHAGPPCRPAVATAFSATPPALPTRLNI